MLFRCDDNKFHWIEELDSVIKWLHKLTCISVSSENRTSDNSR